MADRTLRVLALYPDLMNIYADRGNLTVFERRATWRGIGFELAGAGLGDAIDPDAHDLFYIGGGQDRDQALCARDLATVKRDALHAAADRGAVVFAVCGGLQLLGHGYDMADERLPGVGLVDLDTKREDGPRLLGNIAIELDLPGGPARLAGFENHAGRTYLGAGTAPLGRVLRGQRQQRRGRHRGRARRRARDGDRDVHARSAAAEEHRVRGLADGDGARDRAGGAGAARRLVGGCGACGGGAGGGVGVAAGRTSGIDRRTGGRRSPAVARSTPTVGSRIRRRRSALCSHDEANADRVADIDRDCRR